jgi:hypothetical protein
MQVRHGIELAAGENSVVELFFHGKGIWMGLVVCLVGFWGKRICFSALSFGGDGVTVPIGVLGTGEESRRERETYVFCVRRGFRLLTSTWELKLLMPLVSGISSCELTKSRAASFRHTKLTRQYSVTTPFCGMWNCG